MYNENEKKKQTITIVIVVCLIAISVCLHIGHIFIEVMSQQLNVSGKVGTDAEQSCTVDGVTFYVSKNWTPYEGKDGTFEIKKGREFFQLWGVSGLGGYEPEEFYELLLEQYDNNYTMISSSEALEEATLSDGTFAYLAYVEMTSAKAFYSVGILIAPDEDKVVSYSGQCSIEAKLSFDVEDIMKTTVFQENKIENNDTDTDVENIILGNRFICLDNSEIQMNEDGSFIYYKSKDDHDIAYYKGTYEAYCGQEAVDKIVSMEEYGVTEEEVERSINAGKNGYRLNADSFMYMLEGLYGEEFSDAKTYQVDKDVFYCIILHNEVLYEDGETEELNHDSVYIGYYIDEIKTVDLINVVRANPAMWVLQ